MWIVPFIVGGVFGKAFGKTWTSALVYAGAVGWTSAQVAGLIRFLPFVKGVGSAGAAGRLAFAGQALWGMSFGNVVTAVGLGVVGGIGVSQLLFGDEGRKDAIDLYTGKVSAALYVDTVLKVPGRLQAITQGNRAVENNAAGLPTGTNVSTSYTAPGSEEFWGSGSMAGAGDTGRDW